MATSSLTEFKLGEKTLFSIYTKRGGHPDDMSVSVLKVLNKIKRRKNGLKALLENFSQTKKISGIDEIYQQLNVQFDDHDFIQDQSLPDWNEFVLKYPESSTKPRDVDGILNRICHDPKNVLNIQRKRENGFYEAECHNVIDLENGTFSVSFYEMNKVFPLEGLTITKFKNEIY